MHWGRMCVTECGVKWAIDRGRTQPCDAVYRGWSNVAESVVTIRTPFCGYNTIWTRWVKWRRFIVLLKLNWISLRKCPYDHWLTNKACMALLQWQTFLRVFTYKMAAKINWYRYGTKLRHCQPMYYRPLEDGIRRNLLIKTIGEWISPIMLMSPPLLPTTAISASANYP